jgi:hypothetical protein
MPPSQYNFLFEVDAVNNPNLDLVWDSVSDGPLPNGTTYWYAIASVDHAGQVSDLSAEDVWDTPRPEGVTTLYDFRQNVSLSGFDFGGQSRISAGSILCDVYVDQFDGILYFNAGDTLSFRNTDIQDMGFTGSWDVIGWAPYYGWSNLGYVEVILDHTYVIWTEDDHYAKIRVINVNPGGSVTIQWAYQLQQANPELAPPKPEQDNKDRVAKAVALAE